MRIVCPSCDATYEVPDAMLAGGPRAVKCARCGGEWTPTLPPAEAPTDALAAAPPAEPSPPEAAADADSVPAGKPAGPMAALEAEAPGRVEPRLNPLRPRAEQRATAPIVDADAPGPLAARKVGAGPIAAWILSLVVLIGAGGAVVTWRAQVMAAWPPSQRVFAAVGLR